MNPKASYSPSERAAEKLRSRMNDIALIQSGKLSQTDMRRKNVCLYGLDMSKVVVKDCYGNVLN